MSASAVVVPQVTGYSFEVAPDLSKAEIRRELSAGALRTFVNIVEKWGLTEAQARALLGGVASSTYHAWRTKPEGRQLDQDTLTRISLAIGIYKGLNIYFNKPLADRWMGLGNRGQLFAGIAPIDYMIKNGLPAMVDVRRMIDSWRGGI